MRDEQSVEFIAMERVETVRVVHDAFRVREERPAVWLQRLCCWVLAKLGSYHDVIGVEFVRVPINGDSFMQRLFEQKMSLEYAYRYRPREVIIGAEDYREMMGGPEIRQMLAFDAKTRIGTRDGMTVLGLRVVVVPWMRGFVVMPRDE